MRQYYDPTGFARTAKARTADGRRYPCTVIAAWRMKPLRWTGVHDLTPQMPVLDLPLVAIHCGPDAPYPLVPTPEQILDAALNLDEPTAPKERIWLGWF